MDEGGGRVWIEFDGANVLAVGVDNSAQPDSRWYAGSGIYRHTWLAITGDPHGAHRGVFVTTPEVSPEHALVEVRTRLRNERAARARCRLATALLNGEGNVAGTAEDRRTVGGARYGWRPHLTAPRARA